ncbi:hypothetical protein AB0K40_08790 [Nonomuraea bangladeshensis]|uniref:Secreted protein n=1 Tax=Nonomuraea bangladeshensis TaxID=404385 RepID=A0ABV3GZK9_9ACTN
MISPKHIFAWATAAITGALMAASFQTPAMAGEGPERPDDSIRYDAPIARPSAAPVAGYQIVAGRRVTLANGETRTSMATCNDGRRVLGGGWTSDNADDLVVLDNHAVGNGAAWEVTFRNPLGGDDEAATARATAQCAFVRPSAQSD